MSDRGRNRRPARSTKATPPKATPDEDVSSSASGDAGASDIPVVPDTSASLDEAESSDIAKPAEIAKPAKLAKPAGIAKSSAAPSASSDDLDGSDLSDSEVSDGSDADSDAVSDSDDGDKSDKKPEKAKNKGPAPLTKAEQRAAARVAAAKAARRKRTGQAIAGTLIVLLAVGGAFAGVWYFGDRAKDKATECKKPAEQTYPPLLGGFDKRLAEEPKIEAGKEPRVGLRNVDAVIKGSCKTVKAGDTVVVNYVGATYKDGKVFDSSWERKQTFPVQVGLLEQGQQPQVIEGWDRGLVGVKVGSRIILDIPAKEAYGDTAQQPGAPVGDLRFIVDILDIQDASGGLNLGGN